MQKQQKTSQLKLSIDFHSIKDHQFTAQLYFKYQAIHELGVKSFRSSPTLSLSIPRVQTQLNNCFTSSFFEADADNIKQKVNNKLEIQVWHNDRLKKDIMLGICKIDIRNILSQPLRKTKDSYARVFDAYAPIDQVDQQKNPIKQIGALRILLYLEDLGPISLLKQKGFNVNNLIDQNQVIRQKQVINLKEEGPGRVNSQQDYKRLQLNQLEYKVVWELQTWKKAQEAKTKVSLRQKQIQFLANIQQAQKKNNLEKQKHIKKIEANLYTLQNKLRAKMNDLVKRQQKIIILEQQLQAKLNEVSKELLLKDQEIERIKKRQKEEKTNIIKQKSMLQMQVSKYRAENAKLKVQLEQSRKQDEKSPVNLLKNQINHKVMEMKQLTKQLDKCIQIKEQFKSHYQKMKNQVISLRGVLKEKQQNYSSLKYENAILTNNIKHLQQQIKNQVSQQKQYQAHNSNGYNYNYNRQIQDSRDEPIYQNKKQRLIRERQKMLEYGTYTPDDPFIKQYDDLIASL